MDSLPDEVLLMIFELMPAHEVCAVVSHVCRRWAHVARRRALFFRYSRHMKRLRYHPRALLVSVHLSEPYTFFQSLTLLIPCLQELSVHSEMPLTDSEIKLLMRFNNLSHLDIFTRSRFLGSSLIPIAKRLSSLVINETVARGFLRALVDSARFRGIHMYGRSLHYPRRDLLLLLRSNINQLCELTLRCNELTDAVYEVIALCSNLKSLQLYSCWLMTRIGANYLTGLQKLRCLHITGARMVRNKALSNLICDLPQSIEELVLSASWFSDEHIGVLRERLPKLHTLELWRCRASADGLMELVTSLPALVQFDTDMMLGADNVQILSTHPSLRRVRCRLDPMCTDINSRGQKLKFMAADAIYRNALLRGDGEGYRADLFYYWTQRVPLETLPNPTNSIILDR